MVPRNSMQYKLSLKFGVDWYGATVRLSDTPCYNHLESTPRYSHDKYVRIYAILPEGKQNNITYVYLCIIQSRRKTEYSFDRRYAKIWGY